MGKKEGIDKMILTKRTLTRWRKEALEKSNYVERMERTEDGFFLHDIDEIKEMSERILRMTQILLDQELMKQPTLG